MREQSEDAVLSDERGEVLVITINRPAARNAVNRDVAEGVAAALERLDDEPDLRCAVLTGAGGTFCAGMDLKGFTRGELPFIEGRGFAGLTERGAAKPLIAAVEGYALAGGCEVALACDLIVAARDASFGIPEVKRGLVAAAGGLLRLPRRIPYHVAMELALTGEPIGAERAHEVGLVNRLTEPGGALEAALELAGTLSRNAPLALAASKRIIRESRTWTAAEQWEKMAEIATPALASGDAQEGARAFAEKRDPVWRGE